MAAPAEPRTPNMHRAKKSLIESADGSMATAATRRDRKPCPMKPDKNRLDSDRPSHGRPLHSLRIGRSPVIERYRDVAPIGKLHCRALPEVWTNLGTDGTFPIFPVLCVKTIDTSFPLLMTLILAALWALVACGSSGGSGGSGSNPPPPPPAIETSSHPPFRTRYLRTDIQYNPNALQFFPPHFTAYDSVHRRFFVSNTTLNRVDVFDAATESGAGPAFMPTLPHGGCPGLRVLRRPGATDLNARFAGPIHFRTPRLPA